MELPLFLQNERLFQAVRLGNLGQTNACLQQGADPNYVNAENIAVSHLAASTSRRRHCLRVLFEYGADCDLRESDSDNSLLHTAAIHNNVAALFICVEFGCDIFARNAEDQTPRQAARVHSRWWTRIFGVNAVECLSRFEQAYEHQLREVMRVRRSNRLARQGEGPMRSVVRDTEERVLARSPSRPAIAVAGHGQASPPRGTARALFTHTAPRPSPTYEQHGFIANVPTAADVSNHQQQPPQHHAHAHAHPHNHTQTHAHPEVRGQPTLPSEVPRRRSSSAAAVAASALAPVAQPPRPAAATRAPLGDITGQAHSAGSTASAAAANTNVTASTGAGGLVKGSGSSVSVRSTSNVTDKILLTLDCIICATRMADPTTLECGHTFCRSCCLLLAAHSDGAGFRCPLDRSVHHFVPATNVLLREITQALRQLPSPGSKRPSQLGPVACA